MFVKIMIPLLILIMIGNVSADCFNDVLPKNTEEVKKTCPLVHEQMMVCLPEIVVCLNSVQNSRKCFLKFHNCIEKVPSNLALCENYIKESTDHIQLCTETIFKKIKKEALEKGLKSLKTVLADVFGRNYSSIVSTKHADSLDSLLDVFAPFTNSTKINSDDDLREKVIKVDQNRLPLFKIPLKFWLGGFGNNIVSRLIDRTLVHTLWDSNKLKYVNHAWAVFADCVESGNNKSGCLTELNADLKNKCAENSDQLECGVYNGLVETKLNKTFAMAQPLSNEKIFKVISKFKLNDFWTRENVLRENKLPLFHLEYKHLFESCYSVKRTVSSCLLMLHNCELESQPNCMDELNFCFFNITSAKPKCMDSLIVIRERAQQFVSNFVDYGKERLFYVATFMLWTSFLFVLEVFCKESIKQASKNFWKKISSIICPRCCKCNKSSSDEGDGEESVPLKDVEKGRSESRGGIVENNNETPIQTIPTAPTTSS